MNKQSIYDYVESKAQVITDLSDKIWGFAELSMEEFQSTAAYVEVMKAEGFQVETNLCGIKTAFSGRYGSGKPEDMYGNPQTPRFKEFLSKVL